MQPRIIIVSYCYIPISIFVCVFNGIAYAIIMRIESLKTKYATLNFIIITSGMNGICSLLTSVLRIILYKNNAAISSISNKQCLYKSSAMLIELSKIMEATAFFALSIDRLTFLTNPLFYYHQHRKIQTVNQIILTVLAFLIITWSIYETVIAPPLISSSFCVLSEVLDRITFHGIEIIRIFIYLGALLLYGVTVRLLKWLRNQEMMDSEEMQLFVASQMYYTKTVLVSIFITSLFVIAPITYSEIYTLRNGEEETMEYYLLFVTIWNSVVVVALIIWRQADLRAAFVMPIRRLNVF